MRRALARAGAGTRARALPATVGAPSVHAAPVAGVRARRVPPLLTRMRLGALEAPSAVVHDARTQVRARRTPPLRYDPAAGARAVCAVRFAPAARGPGRSAIRPSGPAVRGADPVPRAPRSHASRALAPLWRTRRRPVPWPHLDRERLRAAWDGMLAEHGIDGPDTELIGVYGRLPLGAVAHVRLDPDRTATITFDPAAPAPGPAGDLALARQGATGPLLRHAIPHRHHPAEPPAPGPGSAARPTVLG